ncbi:MAG: amino acid-binding protein [Lachnospiraceae bacterium]|nr:amino acid-binding protein [Lachnospiraceae bacterium]MDD7023380.1 amino acid-binding protein [Oscillospiraceae bacterium]MDY5540797.1 amino acid-binding protein [Lachnospiraceae bacterium]MDY5648371.1 amino acid-binding protein [Lachnospiraceae bacterium]
MKQLSVFVENVAGSLMKVTQELVNDKINIRAISSFDTPEFGILRLIVDKPEEAVQCLKEKGFFVQTKDVIAVEIEDRMGSLNRMLGVLAEGNISISYIYSFVIRDDNAPVMVFQTEYLEEAVQILKKHGIHVID